jgi:hypothetical protein
LLPFTTQGPQVQEGGRVVIRVSVPSQAKPTTYEVGGQTQYQNQKVVEVHPSRVKIGG